MKPKNLLGCLVVLSITFPAYAQEQICKDEYERGRREMGAWAEMAGIVEGVIYGYSLELRAPEVCLPSEPKPRVKAIATAFMSESFARDPVLMDDVPTRAEALQFLKRFFPCSSHSLPQAGK